MSIASTTISVVKSWAGVSAINNTLTEICVIWAGGHPGQPCAPALQPLITSIRQAFPTKNLSGLRPTDLTGGGSIKTVETLISFIASSPSSDKAFALVGESTLAALGFKKSGAKKGSSKKSGGKSGTAHAKKGKKGGEK